MKDHLAKEIDQAYKKILKNLSVNKTRCTSKASSKITKNK